jgi:hypothetical protein
MQQTSLHYALKDYYAPPGAIQEAAMDGYLVDVIAGDLLIEIQTRNFTALRNKLLDLLERHSVRLVHPIAQEKWIVKLSTQGETPLYRRRSPRRGRAEDVFFEFVHIPTLLAHPNFSLEIVLIQEEEIRREDCKGSWRRRGISIVDRKLLCIIDRKLLRTPSDLISFLPSDLEQPFNNHDLALALKISRPLASKMTYCMRMANVLNICGKKNRSNLFEINTAI